MKNNEKIALIPSPCISNCCLNDDDVCVGCFRSLEEILCWSASTNQQRYGILKQTAIRRADNQINYGQKYQQSND